METNFFKTEFSETEKLKQSFEAMLRGIREEFDDHLESINDNTNEIHANYEYISKVDEKLNKISERIEQMESLMARFTGIAITEDEEPKIKLDEEEKKIFLLLYTAPEEEPLTYAKIGQFIRKNEFLARGYITNMLERGIPLQKRYVDGQALLSLDRAFKEKQAKQGIVEIGQKTVGEFYREQSPDY